MAPSIDKGYSKSVKAHRPAIWQIKVINYVVSWGRYFQKVLKDTDIEILAAMHETHTEYRLLFFMYGCMAGTFFSALSLINCMSEGKFLSLKFIFNLANLP